MKNKKIILDIEEEETLWIGLVEVKQDFSYHELFFRINQINEFKFRRKKDFEVEDFSGKYKFPIFGAFDKIRKTNYSILANHSCEFFPKQKSSQGIYELMMEETKSLIKRKADLIVFSKEIWEDFSTIHFPEKWVNGIEKYPLKPEEELFQNIMNYDE